MIAKCKWKSYDVDMRDHNRSGCPINLALEILGDRWSLLILRDMIFGGKRTYNQFLDSDEKIATNILRDRLQGLVQAGLLTRVADPAHKQRITYHLTESAIQLVPTLVHLGYWGQKTLPAAPPLAANARDIFAGGPPAWGELMATLRQEHLAYGRLGPVAG